MEEVVLVGQAKAIEKMDVDIKGAMLRGDQALPREVP